MNVRSVRNPNLCIHCDALSLDVPSALSSPQPDLNSLQMNLPGRVSSANAHAARALNQSQS
jgi:hypothetical protein